MKYRFTAAILAMFVAYSASMAHAETETRVVDPAVQFVAMDVAYKEVRLDLKKIGYGQPFSIVLNGNSPKVIWPTNVKWANGKAVESLTDEVVVSGFYDGKNYVVTYVWSQR